MVLRALIGLAVGAERVAPVGPYVQDADLHEQLAADSARVLPRDDVFATAVDVHGIYRTTWWTGDGPGLYHSGIWIDVHGEVRPFPDLVGNVRVSIVAPASSYGIVDETTLVVWPSVSWTPTLGEVGATIRGFDLGRRTLGAGLVVQDQEGSGLAAEIDWRSLRARMNWFGTDTFRLDGDLLALSGDLWDDTVGVVAYGTYSWTGGYGFGLYSAHPFASGVTPLAEVSVRELRPAGMLGVRFDRDDGGRFAGGGTAQVRGYADGYMDEQAGHIEHDYLAPEQELLDFVRADNLFVYDDGVLLAAGRAWIVVRPMPWLLLRVDEELARPWWTAQDPAFPSLWWWWRYDAIACARQPENLCVDLYFSNRMTSAVYLPDEVSDTANYPMLFDRWFMGVDVRARF